MKSVLVVVATSVLAAAVAVPSPVTVPPRVREVATMLVDPVCIDTGATLRVVLAPPGAVHFETGSGAVVDVRERDPYDRGGGTGPVDLAAPAGTTTLRALSGDGVELARRTVTVTPCDGFRGRDDFIASGANDLGRPLHLGDLAQEPQRWPDGTTSYAGTAGDLWVTADGAAYALPGETGARYRSAGGPAGPLGAPRTSVTSAHDRPRWTASFTSGFIRGAASTGTHSTSGALLGPDCRNWDRGAPDPRVGPTMDFATSEPIVGLRGGGTAQHYEGGSLYTVPGLGCSPLYNGPVRDWWLRHGAENGPLGYPSGVSQSSTWAPFERGAAYQAPVSSRAPEGFVVLSGDIQYAYYERLGQYPPSATPVSSDMPTPDGIGRFAELSDGSSIYWQPRTRAHVVLGGGWGILQHWASTGWERGPFGYPVGELTRAGGREPRTSDAVWQAFQGGAIVRLGGQVHGVRGAIHARWSALGADGSSLGLPTSEEFGVPGGIRQTFEHGTLTFDPLTGRVTSG